MRSDLFVFAGRGATVLIPPPPPPPIALGSESPVLAGPGVQVRPVPHVYHRVVHFPSTGHFLGPLKEHSPTYTLVLDLQNGSRMGREGTSVPGLRGFGPATLGHESPWPMRPLQAPPLPL